LREVALTGGMSPMVAGGRLASPPEPADGLQPPEAEEPLPGGRPMIRYGNMITTLRGHHVGALLTLLVDCSGVQSLMCLLTRDAS
jgi:hypothetical protein